MKWNTRGAHGRWVPGTNPKPKKARAQTVQRQDPFSVDEHGHHWSTGLCRMCWGQDVLVWFTRLPVPIQAPAMGNSKPLSTWYACAACVPVEDV